MPGRQEPSREAVLSLDKNRDGVVRFGAFELDPENGELRKHGRPTDLKSALRQSAGDSATVHKLPTKTKK